MTLLRTTAVVLLASTLGAGAATVVGAQTPIGGLQKDGTTIQGRVTDVFGNKFVLEDQSGRTLVETGPEWNNGIDVRRGEQVKVVGEPGRGGFDAFRITREDGREITIRSPGGPHLRAGPGREWERDRRAEHEARHGPVRFAMADLERRLKDRGYTVKGQGERHPKHVEIMAENSRGESVELHVDLDGEVYKERAVGSWR